MTSRKSLLLSLCILALTLLAVPSQAQGRRGKAVLNAGSGAITIDYGRPSMKGPTLQGREPLEFQTVGDFWRMGTNTATSFTSPVDLTFGSTKIAKGSYSLFLLKESADSFKLVFNSQTGQWGTQHDQTKDVAQIPLKKSATPSPVDLFTIDLKEAPKGGTIVLSWGGAQLSTDFETGN